MKTIAKHYLLPAPTFEDGTVVDQISEVATAACGVTFVAYRPIGMNIAIMLHEMAHYVTMNLLDHSGHCEHWREVLDDMENWYAAR